MVLTYNSQYSILKSVKEVKTYERLVYFYSWLYFAQGVVLVHYACPDCFVSILVMVVLSGGIL